MHSKQKGDIGEAAITLDLIKRGFEVFKDFGDLSRVDLIAHCPSSGQVWKIQVKAVMSLQDASQVILYTRKSGPNGYAYRYELKHIDVFAVYVLDTEGIYYLSAAEALLRKSSFTLRLKDSANKQVRGVVKAADRLIFPPESPSGISED